MEESKSVKESRRQFMKYLAASPVLGLGANMALPAMADELEGPMFSDPMIWNPHNPNYVVEKPEDALDVFELEVAAYKKTPQAHWGWMSTGADGEGSYRANRQDIGKFAIRPRRLRDNRNADPSREIFGHKYSAPFFLCPIGSHKQWNPDGELATGRASARHNIAQALSTATNTSTTDVNKVRDGKPVFFQLYQQRNWEITKSIVARAERDGCPAVLVTVDGNSARKLMQFERARRATRQQCIECHNVRPDRPKQPIGNPREEAQFSEVPAELWEQKVANPDKMTWEFLKRLRDFTKMDVYVKGIMDVEDAMMCVKEGYGVYVSNHGGRAEDTSSSTIACLAEIAPAVKGKVPIFVDGGFRRGMDIVKAVAMGATMVGVGRPYIWGLASFGEAGVDRVMQILKAETLAAMQQVGANTLKDLHPGMIRRTP